MRRMIFLKFIQFLSGATTSGRSAVEGRLLQIPLFDYASLYALSGTGRSMLRSETGVFFISVLSVYSVVNEKFAEK